MKNKTITSFFKKTNEEPIEGVDDENRKLKRQKASISEPVVEPVNEPVVEPVNEPVVEPVNEPAVEPVVEPVNDPVNDAVNDAVNEANLNSLERDPGKRKGMWKYPPNIREKVKLAYISLGAYQIKLDEYKPRGSKKNLRRFSYTWFDLFPNWLEYSPTTHTAYCFLCYLYNDKSNASHGHSAFTSEGFDNWKKVNDGKNCPFLKHINSAKHKKAFVWYSSLMNQDARLENFIEKQSDEQIRKNRLRLKTTVDVIRWLTYQACALRGHDESSKSKNQGNFCELLKLLSTYNDDVAKVILDNAPYNSKYTSSDIQKEILSIMANKVREHIRSELGDSWFCVMVDESRDVSEEEQMAIVVRFVDANGMIRERFLDLVHVTDTLSATLKANLWNTILKHRFDVSKIRGQAYDGASNMSGEWKGLQALVRQYSPYAYYVHCFAHMLQLALVCVAKEIDLVHQFFVNLLFTINVVCASSKRHDELQMAKAVEIIQLIELGDIKSGKGKNQVGTLKRAGDTRWGSNFKSICSLVSMFNVTRGVLKGIIEDTSHTTRDQRGDASIAYTYLQSFEFVFVLHLMKEVMGKTETLSQALQKKSQDILNAMDLVKATKVDLNDFRNNEWDSLLAKVTWFCQRHDIEMPDMSPPYVSTRYRPRKKYLHVTFEHHYRVDVFNETLDKQLHELDNRFNEEMMELLSLSASLCSKEINIDQIILLVDKYYPNDFMDYEKEHLRCQLKTFQTERISHPKLSEVLSLSDLCKTLVETGKNKVYRLVERVYRLLLTLPVSAATTERAFSAMKIFKNRLRNKMPDAYLADSLVTYIEKEIADSFDTDSIIEEFKNLKGHRSEL